MQNLTDDQLLTKVLQKSPEAWRELVRRFRSLVFRCITRVAMKYEAILSNEDANEVFGDFCINLLRDDMKKLRAYDATRGAKLGSWLGLISINTTYDYLRQTCRRPILDRIDGAPDCIEDRPDALDCLIEKERWDTMNAMLEDFSDKDRTFVELYYARGMQPEQVAVAMNISVKTVYSKKNKVRTKLEALAKDVPTREAA